MWILYALLSAVFAALVAIFAKLGLASVDSTLATTIRAAIMALFLLLLSFGLGKLKLFSPDLLNHRDWALIILSGFSGALSWVFYFLALKSGTTSGVVAIDRLSVVFVAVLASLLLGEKLTFFSFTGALLLFVGALLIVHH